LIIKLSKIRRYIKMSSEEVFEKVKGIIVNQLGVTEASVTLEASFIDDLGADSLDVVELVMALEEEFDIDYITEAVKKFQNYNIEMAKKFKKS